MTPIFLFWQSSGEKEDNTVITFPKSAVDKFRHNNKALRWGQSFYQYMKLDKVTNPQDKEFCDRLYEATDEKAMVMVTSRTDKNA